MPVAASLTLANCEVGPDFKAPKSSLGPFHNQGLVSAETPSGAQPPPLTAYWQGYDDTVLTSIIQRALSQNLNLAAALAQVQQAQAASGEASAQLLPTVDFTPEATVERQSLYSPIGEIGKNLPGYNRDQRLYDVGDPASWEIDLFGGLRRGAEAASAEADAAVAEKAGVRVTIVAETADAYFQIRGDQARLDVAQQQIDTDKHLLDLVQRRRLAGAANDQEEDEAAALLYQAQAAIPPLRTDLEAQFNRLDILLGLQPGTYARELPDAPQIAVLPTIPANETPQEMLQNAQTSLRPASN